MVHTHTHTHWVCKTRRAANPCVHTCIYIKQQTIVPLRCTYVCVYTSNNSPPAAPTGPVWFPAVTHSVTHTARIPPMSRPLAPLFSPHTRSLFSEQTSIHSHKTLQRATNTHAMNQGKHRGAGSTHTHHLSHKDGCVSTHTHTRPVTVQYVTVPSGQSCRVPSVCRTSQSCRVFDPGG